MVHNWIQKVDKRMEKKGTKGIFKRQAQRRGMTTNRFIDVILKEPKKFSKLERKRANLANTFRKMRKKNCCG
jgi:hypothetical protein